MNNSRKWKILRGFPGPEASLRKLKTLLLVCWNSDPNSHPAHKNEIQHDFVMHHKIL